MDDLKKIIATFIGKEPGAINGDTLINSTAIPGSILIHRMYAAINKAGYLVKDYVDINCYGDLLAKLKGDASVIDGEREKVKIKAIVGGGFNELTFTGIDIEHVNSFPKAVDLREDQFYLDTFSDREIAYALLKPNPYETLSGQFAAKEAICKADNDFRGYSFNEIAIEHTAEGVPVFPGFSLSISHANGFSVAVAVKNNSTVTVNNRKNNNATERVEANSVSSMPVNKTDKHNTLIYISLLISIVAIAIALFSLFSKKSF